MALNSNSKNLKKFSCDQGLGQIDEISLEYNFEIDGLHIVMRQKVERG